MNKNDLVASVADSSGLTKADAGRAVDAVFDTLLALLNQVAMFVLLVLVHFLLPIALPLQVAIPVRVKQSDQGVKTAKIQSWCSIERCRKYLIFDYLFQRRPDIRVGVFRC